MTGYPAPLAADGRALVVALDHPLYTYPVPGLQDSVRFVERMLAAGVDGLILSYGTLRRIRQPFGRCTPILKLDLAELNGGDDGEFRVAWTVEQALTAGAGAVLTLVQLGSRWELSQLQAAARVAAEAREHDLPYVLELLPTESPRLPEPGDPGTIAAAARMAAEIGAAVVKTYMPREPSVVQEAVTAGIPILFAGGSFQRDDDALLARVAQGLMGGAAGVAFGRNVWERERPEDFVARLRGVVHGREDGS